MEGIRRWLSQLSFRTGLWILGLCAVCYAVSFAQMALPLSAATKGILWVIFFGLAKTFQYSAIAILGADGVRRVKSRLGRRSSTSRRQ